jgi:hypothetical protein
LGQQRRLRRKIGKGNRKLDAGGAISQNTFLPPSPTIRINKLECLYPASLIFASTAGTYSSGTPCNIMKLYSQFIFS